MQITSFKPFFHWCDNTLISEWVRGGIWQFPMIETIHILALAMLYGCIAIISLRLMGVLMRGWTVAGITKEVMPYLNWSLVLILVSGAMLYLSEATKAYDNVAFWLKIYLLSAALIFHFGVVRRVTRRDNVPRLTGFFVGAISLFLWLGIGCAGRAIGFV